MTPNDRPIAAQRMGVSTMRRVLVVLVPGLAAALIVGWISGWRYGLLAGWMVGASAFVAWTLLTVWPMDAEQTAAHARRDDPGRATLDVLVLGAAVASLGAVAILLLDKADNSALDAVLSFGSIILAWLAVHTVYTTRYAGLYYSGEPGGIDFNEDDPPQYSDFAYLAFTIGMTFQVSDTDLQTKQIRQTLLRHALLSFLFVAIILGATINLVAGLAN
ncbi:MAG: DUF1345 domain-containing protein [Nakamurella sp.]